MKVEYSYKPGAFAMTFQPEDGEGVDSTQKVRMGNKQCTTYLPEDLNIQALHPDVLGLVTVLIVYPYTKSQIILPSGISQAFHNEVKKVTGLSVFPILPKLNPRKAPARSVPALAYSGGIDSTACLTIMPSNTCSVFHDRLLNDGTVAKQEAAHYACQSLQKVGRPIYMIKSNFHYVRHPKGFAVEMSSTIPALLLSDYLGFDSVAIGSTLEYFIDPFQYYEKRTYSIRWEELFRVVDIQLNQPTAGLSEIGNYKLVLHSPFDRFAESCTSGIVGKPCMNCFKCFRKQLTKRTLLKQSVSNSLLDQLFRIKAARPYLVKFPIFFENVITYITANYQGDHPLMNLLKKKTRGNQVEVDWMEKWYSPNQKFIPPKYRTDIKRAIVKQLGVMTAEDEAKVSKWQGDFAWVLSSSVLKKYHDDFVNAIDKHK